MGDLDAVIKAICQLDLVSVPGTRVSYSPLWGHALLGEIIRRLDGRKRALRDIFQDELFGPLAMKDTALGRRRDLSSRVVPIVAHDKGFGDMSAAEVEDHNSFITEPAEIPWMGCIATAHDLFRFAEMLRRGGELMESVFCRRSRSSWPPRSRPARWSTSITPRYWKSTACNPRRPTSVWTCSFAAKGSASQHGYADVAANVRQIRAGWHRLLG